MDAKGTLKILPAQDAIGAHGKTYLFVGFDEIHGYRNWDIFEALGAGSDAPRCAHVDHVLRQHLQQPGRPALRPHGAGQARRGPAHVLLVVLLGILHRSGLRRRRARGPRQPLDALVGEPHLPRAATEAPAVPQVPAPAPEPARHARWRVSRCGARHGRRGRGPQGAAPGRGRRVFGVRGHVAAAVIRRRRAWHRALRCGSQPRCAGPHRDPNRQAALQPTGCGAQVRGHPEGVPHLGRDRRSVCRARRSSRTSTSTA